MPCSGETQRLLLTAAAEPVGDAVLLWRAAALLGIGADAAAPAVADGLIDVGARVRFRHPLALYGVILLLAGIAYWLLEYAILRKEGAGSTLAAAVGGEWKARISLGIFVAAIPLALVRPWIAGVLYAVGVLPWLVPDRRIEREVARAGREPSA